MSPSLSASIFYYEKPLGNVGHPDLIELRARLPVCSIAQKSDLCYILAVRGDSIDIPRHGAVVIAAGVQGGGPDD